MARRLAGRCACDPTRAAGEGTRLAMSALRLDLALVPATEGEAREALQQDEDEHAGGGDEEHRREHARDLKLIARLENAEGEPRLGAARARHEFGNHGADEGEAAADAQAAEEKRQGRRKAQRSTRFRSVLVSPSTVLERTGKKATSHAQISRARGIHLTQRMMRGAMATSGVTWRMTA